MRADWRDIGRALQWRVRFAAVLPGVIAVAFCCASCGKEGVDGGGAGSTGVAATQAGVPRIVSTVPAATLNLVLIGAAGELVGVSKYDLKYLPEEEKTLPVVGDYEMMNYEELVKLKPTVLVIQTAESRIPPRLKETAAAEHIQILNMHFESVEDIWTSTAELGKAAGMEAAAEAAIDGAKKELAEIQAEYKNAPHPKVAYLVSPSDMVISGGKTFVHEMIEMAGGDDVGPIAGDQYPTFGRETLVRLQPEVLLLGAVEEEAAAENDPRSAKWASLPVPAAKDHRVYLVTDPNSQMASVDIGKSVRGLATLIHAGDAAAAAREAGREWWAFAGPIFAGVFYLGGDHRGGVHFVHVCVGAGGERGD